MTLGRICPNIKSTYMIIQQTLSRREKIIGMCAVLVMVSMVAFGYTRTMSNVAQASVLSATNIEEQHARRFKALTDTVDALRDHFGLIKVMAVKADIRSIKECLLDAQHVEPRMKEATAAAAYADCEKLFVEAEKEVEKLAADFDALTTYVSTLKQNVEDYEKLVKEAVSVLKEKNESDLEMKHL